MGRERREQAPQALLKPALRSLIVRPVGLRPSCTLWKDGSGHSVEERGREIWRHAEHSRNSYKRATGNTEHLGGRQEEDSHRQGQGGLRSHGWGDGGLVWGMPQGPRCCQGQLSGEMAADKRSGRERRFNREELQ